MLTLNIDVANVAIVKVDMSTINSNDSVGI